MDLQTSNDSVTNTLYDSSSKNSVAVMNYKYSVEIKELDNKIKSMMRTADNKATSGRSKYICSVCNKEGFWTNIKDHIEANHIEGVSHPCNSCDKTFRSRPSLRMHKSVIHKI